MRVDQAGFSCRACALAAVAAIFCCDRSVQAIDPVDDVSIRIAHLERHLEQVSLRRAAATQANAPDASLLAEVERNIANTLTDLAGGVNRRTTSQFGPQDVSEGPLLAAQLEEPQQQGPSGEEPPVPVRSRWRELQEVRGPEREGVPRSAAPRRPLEGRGRYERVPPRRRVDQRGPSPPEAESREFHLRAAAHQLRLAGMGNLADRLTGTSEVVEERRVSDLTLDQERAARRRAEISRRQSAVSPTEARRIVRLVEARVQELEHRLEDAVEDLEDRIEEIEEVVQDLERRNARRLREDHSQDELPLDLRGLPQDAREQRFHDTIRRFHELLQGMSSDEGVTPEEQVESPPSQTDQASLELDRLRTERDLSVEELNAARKEAARQREQGVRARIEAERQRDEAEEAKNVAETRAAELERELSRLRRQLRRESQRRMELEGKLAEVAGQESESKPHEPKDED